MSESGVGVSRAVTRQKPERHRAAADALVESAVNYRPELTRRRGSTGLRGTRARPARDGSSRGDSSRGGSISERMATT
jgi:hypothetical protein